MVKIFGREPAVWGALVASLVYLVGAFVAQLTPERESLLIGLSAAVIGCVVAFVTHDGALSAILGVLKLAIAVAVGFGLHLSADRQAVIMGAAAAVLAVVVRSQVTAPVAADGGPAALGGAGESGQMGPDA